MINAHHSLMSFTDLNTKRVCIPIGAVLFSKKHCFVGQRYLDLQLTPHTYITILGTRVSSHPVFVQSF